MRRNKTLLVAGGLAAAGVGGIAAIHFAKKAEGQPPVIPPSGPRSITLSAKDSSLVPGQETELKGRVETKEGGVPEAKVRIYVFVNGRAMVGGPHAETDLVGRYAIPIAFEEAGEYGIYVSDSPQGT